MLYTGDFEIGTVFRTKRDLNAAIQAITSCGHPHYFMVMQEPFELQIWSSNMGLNCIKAGVGASFQATMSAMRGE